jgi:hypothetical protein
MSDEPEQQEDDLAKDIALRYRHHETTVTPSGDQSGATATNLAIAGLDPFVRDRFGLAAAARGLTAAEYLGALVELHEAMRALVDRATHPEVDQTLRRLRLGSVTV